MVAALATAIAGLFTATLSRRQRREHAQSIESVDEIAKAASAAAEERKARVLEMLVSRLPNEGDAQRSIEQLSAAIAKIGALPLKPGEKGDADSWTAVEGLVTAYHTQALDQARVQFWFSVVAASIGFVLIVFMTSTAKDATELQLVLKSVPGIAIDAVAALFFKQASETRERATALYDRLRSDSEKQRALDLVNSIEVPTIRAAVQAQLALHMAGFKADAIDYKSLFSQQPTGGAAH